MAPTLGHVPVMIPPDIEADTRAYYRARAAEYEQWIQRQGRYAHSSDDDAAWNRELESITQFVESLSIGSVFEIASGTGWWSRVLARNNTVFASDYAPEMLAEVAKAAVEMDGVKHMVLTTGTPKGKDRGAQVMVDSARASKVRCSSPPDSLATSRSARCRPATASSAASILLRLLRPARERNRSTLSGRFWLIFRRCGKYPVVK